VARQMTVRGDFISLWWPCSPRETEVFQTKPVLTYWLMSLAMHVFGVAAPGNPAGEMALGTGGEWAVRAPSCVMAALALASLYAITARLAGRRAGLLAALSTATLPMFAQLARQGMTDMPFVGLMTPAIGLAVLALERPPAPAAPRHATPAALATALLFIVAAVPQLLVDSLQLRVRVPWPGGPRTMYGIVAMAPYWLGAAGVLLFIARTARAQRKDVLALLAAATLAGLAVLAKGLAGLALPVVVLLAYVATRHGWARFRDRGLLAGLGVALVAVVVVAVPWHHAMYIRHGAPWWNELFGDNHWRRLVLGRHGDRGTFVYFLRELGYGAWPFIVLVVPALLGALRPPGPPPEDPAQRLAAARRRAALTLGLVWFVSAYAVVSLSMTKFHHYLLPALPGLGILLGCFLDDLRAQRRLVVPLLAGLPLLGVVTYDLCASQDAPEKFLWLFSYDYVHSRGGRPWPPGLEFRPLLLALGVGLTLATALLAFGRTRRLGLYSLPALALAGTVFVLDWYMPKVATSWSQKGTIARYYRERRGPEEHLLAYYMFWRGETFYTKNAIFEGPAEERTVFDHWSDTDARLTDWLARHRGNRHFFLFEPGREGHLRSLLPSDAQGTFRIIERSNNKFVLAVAQL
jgi:4-amino-4-deoxy-L-arabinose transferase-like glycosyltransferase